MSRVVIVVNKDKMLTNDKKINETLRAAAEYLVVVHEWMMCSDNWNPLVYCRFCQKQYEHYLETEIKYGVGRPLCWRHWCLLSYMANLTEDRIYAVMLVYRRSTKALRALVVDGGSYNYYGTLAWSLRQAVFRGWCKHKEIAWVFRNHGKRPSTWCYITRKLAEVLEMLARVAETAEVRFEDAKRLLKLGFDP